MEPELWDCVNEHAPFGSDEGAEAYDEYRKWRRRHPTAPLVDCIRFIGDESNYPDEFTYDATIIATVLGQLIDEGEVDMDAKPFERARSRGKESRPGRSVSTSSDWSRPFSKPPEPRCRRCGT